MALPIGSITSSIASPIARPTPAASPNAAPAGSGSRGDSAQTSLVGVYSTTDAPDQTYRFYASTPAYHVDSSSSIGAGSVFVGKVSFSGAFTGNATVVSRNGTT